MIHDLYPVNNVTRLYVLREVFVLRRWTHWGCSRHLANDQLVCVLRFQRRKDPVQVLILETKAALRRLGLLDLLGEVLDLAVTPDRSVAADAQLGGDGGVVGLE